MTDSKTTAAPAAIQARDRLIIALDVDSGEKANQIVAELRGRAGAFKVGLQLFTAAGPEFVRGLCESGLKIFLDLKFHDIPNTVAKAGVEAARLGVWMFNIHASGGNEMMRRTVSEVGEFCEKRAIRRPKIIGVTVLTSLGDDALHEIGIEGRAGDHVVHLAGMAADSGLEGVVASPLEIERIHERCGPAFLTVTPGIRPTNAANNDQKRVTTPAEALRAGADYLVVGRPVTAAADLAAAADIILNEIAKSIK
jgi:orotidine-5'-phosphate decarboxylase